METRLQMLETALHGEVERVQLAADQVDSVVTDMRSAIGDAHDMADVVNGLGDRLTALSSIERSVSDAVEALARGETTSAPADSGAAVDGPTHGALDELSVRIDSLVGGLEAANRRAIRAPEGDGAAIALADQLDSLAHAMAMVDARSAGAVEQLAIVQAAQAQTSRQLEAIAKGLSNGNAPARPPEGSLAPVIDRLAVVLDGLTAVSA
ncbi:MAG: hypothetical protein ABIV94_01605, partial [Acidimicrobiales bacterium]